MKHLLLLQFLALASSVTNAPPTVLVGQLLYVQAKGSAEMAHERAFYVHDNLQYVVVETDKILGGNGLEGQILIGIRMSGNVTVGSRLVGPGYAVLDSSVWHVGARVIVRATPSEDSGWSCRPAVTTVDDGFRSTGPYLDDALNNYRRLRVYCANDDELFLIQSAAPSSSKRYAP